MENPIAEVKDINKIEAQKPVLVFGKDIREINCFRKSFIYGVYTAVAGGLGTFLFTSKSLFSTNMAIASLWIGFLGYWVPCRYKYETGKLMMEEVSRRKLKALNEEYKSDKTS